MQDQKPIRPQPQRTSPPTAFVVRGAKSLPTNEALPFMVLPNDAFRGAKHAPIIKTEPGVYNPSAFQNSARPLRQRSSPSPTSPLPPKVEPVETWKLAGHAEPAAILGQTQNSAFGVVTPASVEMAGNMPPLCQPVPQAKTGPLIVANKARSCQGCVKDKKKCDGGRPCGRCKKKGRACVDAPKTRKRKLNNHFCLDCYYAKRPKYSFPSVSNLRRHQRESCIFNPNRTKRQANAIKASAVSPSKMAMNEMRALPPNVGAPFSSMELPAFAHLPEANLDGQRNVNLFQGNNAIDVS